MDRRSWLWRRKSEKSPGETESSGSLSSERHSGEQEVLKTSSITSSPYHAQSPEDSSKKDDNNEANETVKSLNDKLSAALLNISAKEDLVKQHAKVAEEAVLGWENAEKEVSSLKQQLEAALKKNSSLEDKATHLDAALKECVRQLRLTREEVGQKVHDAILKKTHEWESEKSELEIRLIELQAQLEVKAEMTTSFDYDSQLEIEALKQKNSALKVKLVTLTKDLHMRALELELSTRTAETASKQHLDSIKKIARLEAECSRLRAASRKSSFANEPKLISNSHYVDSVTDCLSDLGERLLSLDNEQSSDSWASAPVVEPDQFRKEKDIAKSVNTSVQIELMDDFLEMEKLVALPEADHGSSSIVHDADSESSGGRDSSSRKELAAVNLHVAELEEMIAKISSEKVGMERSLDITNNQLKHMQNQLAVAEVKLVEMQRQLNLINGEKCALEIELETTEGKKSELELQLELAITEKAKLNERVTLLDQKFEEEKKISAELKLRCQQMQTTEAKKNELELQLESAYGEIKELKGKVSFLEEKFEEEKKLSAELASRCWRMDTLKGEKEELECQIESAKLELHKLHENVDSVERKLEEEKAFSMELLTKCQTMELINAKKVKLEYQLSAKDLEVGMVQEKVIMQQGNVEKERAISSALAANIETLEAKGKEGVMQLELAHVEVKSLQEKLCALEKQVEVDRASSAEFAAKYQRMEHELLSRQQATEFDLSLTSNRKLIIRQEKETAIAAVKLAECQKTIASINQQLKSLSNLDDFMLETDVP